MGSDPRREGDGSEEEQQPLPGRAPPAQPTAKIGAFDLEQALAKSRGDEAPAHGVPTPAIPFPAESAPQAAPEPPPKRSTAPIQMVVLAVLTIATLAFAIYAARSM